MPWYWQTWFLLYLARISMCMLRGCRCSDYLSVPARLGLLLNIVRKLIERTS